MAPPLRPRTGSLRIVGSLAARPESDAEVVHLRSLPLRDAEPVRAPKGELTASLRALNADPDVRYAEPNSVVHGQTSDPEWPSMWGLENSGQSVNLVPGVPDADIDAPQAWASSTGAGVRVGVLDSGLDVAQPDLLGQVAVNPRERRRQRDERQR
jgi:hypothetical protein